MVRVIAEQPASGEQQAPAGPHLARHQWRRGISLQCGQPLSQAPQADALVSEDEVVRRTACTTACMRLKLAAAHHLAPVSVVVVVGGACDRSHVAGAATGQQTVRRWEVCQAKHICHSVDRLRQTVYAATSQSLYCSTHRCQQRSAPAGNKVRANTTVTLLAW